MAALCKLSAADLASALGGEPAGSGYVARCPAHADSTPSLSIWTAPDGATAWKCHAGCAWGGVTDAIRAKVPDAFPGQRPRKKSAGGKIVATYDYTDADGNLVAQVCRFDPKNFRQRAPDGKGGWTWRVKGLQLPIYNAPRVARAQAVYIVEGEKDADAMASLGLIATCNSGGAGKWREHHTDAVTGKRLCLIPDKDGPGRSHMERIAALCNPVAESVRVFEVPDPHKDPADWIEGGATRDHIIEATRAATLWTPPTSAFVGTNGANSGHENWRAGLIVSGEDVPRPLLANAMHALRYAPSLAGILSWDNFSQRVVVSRATPWGRGAGERWTSTDDMLLAEWLQHTEIRVGADMAGDAASAVAHEHDVDSLQDYLASLRWDGRHRLAGFGKHFGAPEGLPWELLRLFLISAIARAYDPGCQVDHILVLEGRQGTRKSTALRSLFDPLGARWFRDKLPALDSKDADLQLVGAWGIEISELETVNSRRSEMEQVKAFISRRVDSYRPPYERRVVDLPRRTVFAGSTNEGTYLRDTTGNRRWWPFPCGQINQHEIETTRDQVWAEAVTEYERGQIWWIEGTGDEITEYQEQRRTADPWEDLLEGYLATPGLRFVTTLELFDQLDIKAERRSQAEANRIGRLMRHFGWTRRQIRGADGRRYWGYAVNAGISGTDVRL